MEQKQGSPNGENHSERDKADTKAKVWSVTGTALSIQIFLLALFLLGLGTYSYIPDPVEGPKAFLEGMFNLAIVIVVVVHGIIYYKQTEAMNAQLSATRESVTQNRQALEIAERAHLGIHSIKENFDTGRMLIRIENTGKAPATDIELFAEGIAQISEAYADAIAQAPPWQRHGNGWRLAWPLRVDYWHTMLLAGSNPLIFPFSLASWLNGSQRKVIQDGHGHLIFRGHITFHDGFRPDQKIEFAFKYSEPEKEWIHHPVSSPDEVLEKLRERTEQYFGKEGPLFRMIETYPPRVVTARAQRAKADGDSEN